MASAIFWRVCDPLKAWNASKRKRAHHIERRGQSLRETHAVTCCRPWPCHSRPLHGKAKALSVKAKAKAKAMTAKAKAKAKAAVFRP